MDVFKEVREIMSMILDIDESKIKPESILTDDLGADSLDLTELVVNLEIKLDVEIYDENVQNIFSINDFVAAIEEQIKREKKV